MRFYSYGISAEPRKNIIKLTLVPQNDYLGSEKPKNLITLKSHGNWTVIWLISEFLEKGRELC
jgi:hypothetical protein